MESGVIAKGVILSVPNGQRYIIGSRIGVNGITEIYEAAAYDGKPPTNFPTLLQIIPHRDDKPLPLNIQFFIQHAKPNDLDNWKRANRVQHLGIPALLGAGNLRTNNQIYKFIITERHGRDLWSLFLERNRKFEPHTAYKIALQMITILKYTHSKSFVQGDFRTSNIVVDAATQNRIYLVDDYTALCTVSVEQEDPNRFLSRDIQMEDSTMRGDMETLFYSLVFWLGIELPWKKNFEDPTSVLTEQIRAFKDVETFLKKWSKVASIPVPVCEFMKLLAAMKANDKPIYHNFKHVLVDGLRKLYHVPTGKLEFFKSNVPVNEQIAEDPNQVNKLQKRYKKLTSIPNLGISVAKVAKIISANCRNEGEVRLRDIGPGSLLEIICELTCKKKSNAAWQNRLANAWERDTAGLKTMTKSLWREKESRTKRNANEAVSTKKGQVETRQDSTAAAPALANNNEQNHGNPGTSNSQIHCEVVNPDGMPPNEHTASLELPNISPAPNVRQTPRSTSPSRWSGVQSFPIRPGTSGYSSRSPVQDDSHSRNMSVSRTSGTEHSQLPEVVVLEVKEETNKSDVEVIECRRSESTDCESWHDKYKTLDAWLRMKEQNFGAFGSIRSEPQMVTDQVQQVRVLLDEFYGSLRLRKLKNAKLPSDPAVEPLLERIEYRWWDLQAKLEKRGKELGDACREKLRDALQKLSDNLDKLSLDNDPEEQQLTKIGILSGQLEDLQGTLLANVTAVTEQLCQTVRVSAYTSDLRVQLRSVNNLYSDVQQKVATKKADVESCLNDGRQFDDSCKEAHVWLAKELENIVEKPLVSTDRTTLQQQRDHYKVKHQRVMNSETEVMELLEKGRSRVRSQNSTQQRFLESIESQWHRLSKKSFDIVKKLETCTESCDKFYQTHDLFSLWLSEAEGKLESIKTASLDEIGKQLMELYALRDEVLKKSDECKQCIDLGHAFIGICDVDEDNVVKNELSVTKDRWAKLNRDLTNRLQSFEDSNKRFDSESNGRGSTEKTSELSSRNRRTPSKDLVSSPPGSSNDSPKSHNSHKYDDSMSNSDLNSSKPKRFRDSKDSDDPPHSPQSYNKSDQNHQSYHFSNMFQNVNRRDRAQSVSHCDLRFARDYSGWDSQSPRNNLGWIYYQNQPVRQTFRENSDYRQSTTARNWKSNGAEEQKRIKEHDDMSEKNAQLHEREEDQRTGLEGRNQQKEKKD